MSCKVAYEVSRTSIGKVRSVVFTTRRAAKAFKRDNPGSTIAVVSLCDGKISKRGKRKF